jgi:hypothetical protein
VYSNDCDGDDKDDDDDGDDDDDDDEDGDDDDNDDRKHAGSGHEQGRQENTFDNPVCHRVRTCVGEPPVSIPTVQLSSRKIYYR